MHLAKTINFTQPKVWNTNPKKTHWKNEGAKKSVEKMQARGKTCFWRNTRDNTTHSKVRKHDPKIQPQMRHTNTTTTPKNNPAPRDVIRGYCPPTHISGTTTNPLAGREAEMANGNRKYLTLNTPNATTEHEWKPEPRNIESGQRNRTLRP